MFEDPSNNLEGKKLERNRGFLSMKEGGENMRKEILNVHEGKAAVAMARAEDPWMKAAVLEGRSPAVFIVHFGAKEQHWRIVPRGKKREKWLQK